jgi:ABC-type branched-subunit amino acid transport system substrate-binding protein
MKRLRAARLGVATLALVLFTSGCAGDREGTDGQTAGSGSTEAESGESFGTLESPCGEGDASGATDQGVTDDSITIGYGDDRGFASIPGLNAEMGDAVSALIDWCNEQGGINGREIVGNQYDAAYTQAAAVMQEACTQDFMLVGQGFAYDEAAEPVRVGCNLPTVAGFTVGPNSSMGPMKFEPLPYPVDLYNSAPLQLAAEQFPEFSESLALVVSNSPPVQQGSAKVTRVLGEMGIEPKDCGVLLSAQGDASYVPFAERFKGCGVEALFTAASPGAGQFSLLESMARIGLEPTLMYEATWYNEAVTEWNAASGAGDNLHVGLAFQPFENADEVPAVQKYLDIVGDAGGKQALLGMQATSAFLLWATVAKECGSDLTRQCMIDGLSQVTEWDGGGLHGPSNPGGNEPTSCAVLLDLNSAEWTQAVPEAAGEFECNDEWVLETDPATVGVTLDENRVSTKFLTDAVLTPSS